MQPKEGGGQNRTTRARIIKGNLKYENKVKRLPI